MSLTLSGHMAPAVWPESSMLEPATGCAAPAGPRHTSLLLPVPPTLFPSPWDGNLEWCLNVMSMKLAALLRDIRCVDRASDRPVQSGRCPTRRQVESLRSTSEWCFRSRVLFLCVFLSQHSLSSY